MLKFVTGFLLFVPCLSFGQSVESRMYSWKNPATVDGSVITFASLFSGSATDMEYIGMDAVSITPSGKKISMLVPAVEEHLVLIKSGTLKISINDSTWSIGRGSIALMLPNERYGVQNGTSAPCEFFLLKYRSKLPIDPERTKGAGSFVKDWNAITFKPHDKGGIRNYFERTTAMCKRLEMHVTTLNPGIQSHDPHTHRAEEIVLVIEGETEMQIDDKFYKGGAADLYYLGSNKSHAIRNIGKVPCTYFAFQFE